MAETKPILNQRLSSLIEKYSARDIVSKLEQQFKSLQRRELNPLMIDDIPVLKEVTIRSDQLRDLLESLTEKPMLNPLIVRQVNGRHQMILGRKIWYATKLLKFTKVPVVITTMSEEEMLLVLLASLREEPVQNVMAIALVCHALIDQFQYRQVALAKIMHYSRSQVSNLLRLLKLPMFTRKLINAQTITYGHAKILVSLDPEVIDSLVLQLIKEKLSVREFEALVKKHKPQVIAPVNEAQLMKVFQSDVVTTKKSIKFTFDSSESLKAFVQRLLKDPHHESK
jgi:ParB family transcriptional regulator, chromosome partitioning protein